MTDRETSTRAERKAWLRAAAEAFLGALAQKDFAAIPYDDNVVFRAPIAPGGRHSPLMGKEAVRTIRWRPLVPMLWEVKVIEHYCNEELTAIVTEADIHSVTIAAVAAPVAFRPRDRTRGDSRQCP